MTQLMTAPNQPPKEDSLLENDHFTGAELVVKGLASALAGTGEIIITETDGGFELTIIDEDERGAA